MANARDAAPRLRMMVRTNCPTSVSLVPPARLT